MLSASLSADAPDGDPESGEELRGFLQSARFNSGEALVCFVGESGRR
jgi:hypothetical protein